MFPYLFELGPLKIGSYGLLMAIGFLFGWQFMRVAFARRGWDPEFAYTIVVNSMISGIIGARLFHVIDHWDHFQGDLGRIFTVQSGLTWYGGLILAIITSYYWCWRRGYKFTATIDAVAPMLASGYAFGRLGCFFAGDGCYGIPTEAPWDWLGIAFPKGLVPTSVPVHPTMLYEAAFNFALWGILFWVDGKYTIPNRWRHGLLFAIFMFFHSVERLFVEFIRINDRYWFKGFDIVKFSPEAYFDGRFGLSFSQWISIAGIVAAIVLFAITIRGKSGPYPIQTGESFVDTQTKGPARKKRKKRKKR